MVLGRIIVLLLTGIYLIPCHSEQVQYSEYTQASDFEDISEIDTPAEKLIRYANRIQKLSTRECIDEINRLEAKPSEQRSFDDNIKLALLLSHSDEPHKNDRRALNVLTNIESKNATQNEFIRFLSNLLEDRMIDCQQTQCKKQVKSDKERYDTLLHEQNQLKSKLKKERKKRKELQEQLDALMELEESINERETLDSNGQ